MLLFAGGSVKAASKQAAIGIKLTVEQACEAGSRTSGATLSFGVLDMGTVPTLLNQVQASGTINGAGAIRVRCAPGVSYKVSLGKGLNSGGGLRKMAGPQGGLIEYGLYQDSGYNRIWDDTHVLSVQGTGSEKLLPVYAVVKPQRTRAAGTYRDTVRVLVEW